MIISYEFSNNSTPSYSNLINAFNLFYSNNKLILRFIEIIINDTRNYYHIQRNKLLK